MDKDFELLFQFIKDFKQDAQTGLEAVQKELKRMNDTINKLEQKIFLNRKETDEQILHMKNEIKELKIKIIKLENFDDTIINNKKEQKVRNFDKIWSLLVPLLICLITIFFNVFYHKG